MSIPIATTSRLAFSKVGLGYYHAVLSDGIYKCVWLNLPSKLWTAVFDPHPAAPRLFFGSSYSLRQCMYKCDRAFFLSQFNPPPPLGSEVSTLDYFVQGTPVSSNATLAYVWPDGTPVGYLFL